jgi:hypothetical protein
MRARIHTKESSPPQREREREHKQREEEITDYLIQKMFPEMGFQILHTIVENDPHQGLLL